MSTLFQTYYQYRKKIKRAKRIEKLKKKIPPYLKKDFGVELNYKIWITKGARFAASERNRICDRLSSQTIGYLSAYLIIINLFSAYDIDFIQQLTPTELGFTSSALSILILIYSQFESAKGHSLKSEKYHQCSLELGELYNELRMVKTFKELKNPEARITQIAEKYDTVLRKYENHIPIDTETFKLTKADYFDLSTISSRWIKIKKYFLINFKYHVMIWGPPILFLI